MYCGAAPLSDRRPLSLGLAGAHAHRLKHKRLRAGGTPAACTPVGKHELAFWLAT